MFDRIRARVRKMLGLPATIKRPRPAITFHGGCGRCGGLETRCNETQVRCSNCGAFLRRIDDEHVSFATSLSELAKRAWTIKERFGAVVAIAAFLFFARGAQGA